MRTAWVVGLSLVVAVWSGCRSGSHSPVPEKKPEVAGQAGEVALAPLPPEGPMGGELTAEEQAYVAKASRRDENGWIYLHIEGAPFERGFQRGYLTGKEIEKACKAYEYFARFYTGKDVAFLVEAGRKMFGNKITPEYVEEMRGIAAGARRAGYEIGYGEVLFLNTYVDLAWYWWPVRADKDASKKEGGCSAFIATGDATRDGGIVMGHNSWDDFGRIASCNLIIDLHPDKGHKILMQSCDAALYSSTDFFITDAGLVGTETTISGFEGYDEKGRPVFDRVRKATQYADNIDEWAEMAMQDNNGAYPNSWLLGNVNTGEIARFELGLKTHELEQKKNGYFVGSNLASDMELLRGETGLSWDAPVDIRTAEVARKVRWQQLMKEYLGKIDVEVGKKVLADHYDVYLKKEQPSQRTLCGHWELDDGSVPGSFAPYLPVGAVDGKVVDSAMAKKWQFWARWGHPCGTPFKAEEFLAEHPQYEAFRPYLPDFPTEPWTVFQGQE